MCIHGSHVQIHWNLIGHKHDLPAACVIAKQSSSAVRRVSPLFPEREFGRDLNVFQFLSAFRKIAKSELCLSVRVEHLGFLWTDIQGI